MAMNVNGFDKGQPVIKNGKDSPVVPNKKKEAAVNSIFGKDPNNNSEINKTGDNDKTGKLKPENPKTDFEDKTASLKKNKVD